VRLFYNTNTNKVHYNANRGLPNGPMVIETGIIDATTGNLTNTSYPKISNQGNVEKNWVYLPTKSGEQKMIYGWSPLLIGDIVQDEEDENASKFVTTHEIKTPWFFKNVRGSTNGIIIDNEIWVVCHVVSYEDRRYYYHLMVVLDADTYAVKKYTELFSFEKEKVEYTLGLIHEQSTNEFLIGYSTMDCDTRFMSISKNKIDNLMIYL